MDVERVAVTGGNGTIGEAIIAEFAAAGYETVNVARGSRREEHSDRYQSVDLLDAGGVYGALSATDPDAVVHMGTIPTPRRTPGYETYRSNVQSAYHVLEAAEALDVERVVLPSSINVMGAAFQDAPIHVEYLPVDEAHPVTPRDPYGVAKHAMEVTADGVARRPDGPSIVTLRFPWVETADRLRSSFEDWPTDPAALGGDRAWTTRDVLFTYLELEDAASAARLAVEAEIEGHERIWAVAPDPCVDVPTEDLIAEHFPDAERREPLSGTDGLVTIEKSRQLLGWEPEWRWRGD